MPNPSYPSFAKSSRMQGSVKLLIRVSATGGIDSTTVIGTSGFSALDDYVANAVRRSWRLNPGPAGSYTKTFTFQLR
jgi:TonB family protein